MPWGEGMLGIRSVSAVEEKLICFNLTTFLTYNVKISETDRQTDRQTNYGTSSRFHTSGGGVYCVCLVGDYLRSEECS